VFDDLYLVDVVEVDLVCMLAWSCCTQFVILSPVFDLVFSVLAKILAGKSIPEMNYFLC